jgi:hypothetical protein
LRNRTTSNRGEGGATLATQRNEILFGLAEAFFFCSSDFVAETFKHFAPAAGCRQANNENGQ